MLQLGFNLMGGKEANLVFLEVVENALAVKSVLAGRHSTIFCRQNVKQANATNVGTAARRSSRTSGLVSAWAVDDEIGMVKSLTKA